MRTPLALRRYPQHFHLLEDEPVLAELAGEDLDAWGDKCCGLACLRSIVAYHDLVVPSQSKLLARSLGTSAWSPRGWVHAELIGLAREHGLDGAALAADLPALERLANAGLPTVVSVTIRFPVDGSVGGHLVVFGGRGPDGHVHFADPSRWGADNTSVPPDRFAASYSGRAIVLWPSAAPGRERPLSKRGPDNRRRRPGLVVPASRSGTCRGGTCRRAMTCADVAGADRDAWDRLTAGSMYASHAWTRYQQLDPARPARHVLSGDGRTLEGCRSRVGR